MKNKTKNEELALEMLKNQINSSHAILKKFQSIEHLNTLKQESLTAIKNSKIKKGDLEILLSSALSELIYLKNIVPIYQNIDSLISQYFNIVKIIKTTPNKQKPTQTYLRSWAIFLELWLKESKNPSLKEFEDSIDKNLVPIESDTKRKYWREFKKKIDSGLFLVSLFKK